VVNFTLRPLNPRYLLGKPKNRIGYRGVREGFRSCGNQTPAFQLTLTDLRSRLNSVSGRELQIAPEESSEVTAICYTAPGQERAVAPAHLSPSGGGRVIRIKCDHTDVCIPLFLYISLLWFSRLYKFISHREKRIK
jgi:hypothetical protein